jgi:chemotaxis protein methyltransferase CheR
MLQNQTGRAADISDREFARFQSMLYDIAGISLADSKKTLVVSRLSKRLREYQLGNFSDYLKLIDSNEHPHELQTAVDLLTTNETYFFREQNHFTFLKEHAEKSRNSGADNFRVWSAACSSGQEPYSIAMVLDSVLGNSSWEIQASDISTQVLDKARLGLYPIAQADNISNDYLMKYCLKGVGSQLGTFAVDRKLRDRVRYFHGNLNTATPKIGLFDVIFLRNVMIYFDVNTKRQVVARLQAHLKSGGYLLIGHSESLNGINDHLKMVAPSIFRKP